MFRHFPSSNVHPAVQPETTVRAVASAMPTGLAFGTHPARRAAELSPVEAIARECVVPR